VLLKNDHHLLPLDPHANVLVAGDGADDIGKQAGGWTLSWQGTGNKPADFPNAESIWSGIRAATGAAGGHATLSVEGQYTTKPDVAIVVFGEDPYAEFIGDRDNLLYRKDAVSQQAQEHDLNLLRRLHADGIPVVAVFLSGRPLWVNREINASDAFVAAWLPGSEGGGVADLLFRTADGKVAYDFTGRLSYSWPKTANQGPLNVGQAGYDPQFAFGYGLGYGHDTALGTLSEDSGLKQDKPNPDEYYAAGKLAIGWTPEIAGAAGEPTSPIDKLEGSILAPRFHTLTTDHLAQEDAWKLVWTGTGPLRFWIQTDEARDLSGQARQGLSLVITMRLDTPPTANVDIGMACGTGCAGRVALTPLLGQLTPGRWTRVAVPLKCFEQAGADLKRVTGVLELGTAGAFSLAFSRVALGTEYDQAITCPAP
jgi:beta-glucosidase